MVCYGWNCDTMICKGCQPRGDTDASDAECSNGDEPDRGESTIDLRLTTLESYHQLHGTSDASQHAENGVCPKRIKECLQDPQCSCGKCSMPFSVLLQCCKSFWGLPKQQQDAILWSLQSGERGQPSTWSMEGHRLLCSYTVQKQQTKHHLAMFLNNIFVLQGHQGVMKSHQESPAFHHFRIPAMSHCLAAVSGCWEAADAAHKTQVQGIGWKNHQPRSFDMILACISLY